jgi:hypothetical protein
MMNDRKSTPSASVATTAPPPSDDAPWLTLRDVLQTSPAESQAETILLRNIMETVANETTAEDAMNILESIPDEALHLFTTSSDAEKKLLDMFSPGATSPRSFDAALNHNTIPRPSHVQRFTSHSPPPWGRFPKKSSSVSSKQRRPSQLATMAQRWDAFQHVGSHPSQSKTMPAPSIPRSDMDEMPRSVPSAAEILVLQSRRSDEPRQPSIHYTTAASTSPHVVSSIFPRPHLSETVTSSPESLILYKKTDSFVEGKESLDEAGHDVECGGATTTTSLGEQMNRRQFWRQGLAWCKSHIQKPPSHPNLILQRLLPKKQHTLWNDFEIFMEQRRDTFFHYTRFFLWIVLPALAIAFILFYFAGKSPMFWYSSCFEHQRI